MFNMMLLFHTQINLIYDIKKYIMRLYIIEYCKNPANTFHFSCLCHKNVFTMQNKKTIANDDIYIINQKYFGWTPTQILIDAHTNNRFDVVDFIVNDAKDDHVCHITHNLYRLGRFDILRHRFNYSLHSGNCYLLQISCTNNHREIVEFMLSAAQFTPIVIYEILLVQCKIGHLQIVKLITSTKYVDENTIKKMLTLDLYNALETACTYNRLDIYLHLERLLIHHNCKTKLLIKVYDKGKFQCHMEMQSQLKQSISQFRLINALQKKLKNKSNILMYDEC